MRAMFGGTFDPIHIGHLRVALEVAEALDATVHLMPANVPPHRPQPIATANQRLRMVQLAVQGEARLVADDRELRRSKPSYSFDTLSEWRAEIGFDVPLTLVVGWDAFAGFATWHRWSEIFSLAHVCVVTRPGPKRELEAEIAAEWYARKVESVHQLHQRPSGCVFAQAVTALDVSATKIRAVLRENKSARYLVPDAVQQFIESERLYVGAGKTFI